LLIQGIYDNLILKFRYYFILDNKEPENPVVYLSNIVKRLDVRNRNGIVALAIVNLLVILLLKFYLKGSGLLT